MIPLIVNFAHLAGAGVGFALIVWAAGQERLRAAFWPAVWIMSAIAAAIVFYVSDPFTAFEDFRRAYWEGGVAALHGPSAFPALFERGTDGFVNIPVVAYLFAPFGLMSENAAAIVFTVLGVAAVIVSWRMMTILLGADRRDSALLLFGIACFGPLLYSIREGNLSHVLLVPLLGGLIAFKARRDLLAGALFGLFALIKPAFALIGVYYLLRGQWRVVAGGAAVLVGSTLLSLLIFGWDMHVLWYEKTIVPFASGPLPAFNAQSFASAIARAETDIAAYTQWEPHVLSQTGSIIVALLSLAAVAVAGWACLSDRRWQPERAAIELETLIVVTLVCLASSLTWSHYYVWLLPAYALVIQRLSGAWRIAAIASLALSLPAEFISSWMREGAYGPASNILTSHLLIGGILVLACLCILRMRRA